MTNNSPFTLFASVPSSSTTTSSSIMLPPPIVFQSDIDERTLFQEDVLYPSASDILEIDQFIGLTEAHDATIEGIQSMLKEVFHADLLKLRLDDITEYLTITFLYFPPLSWGPPETTMRTKSKSLFTNKEITYVMPIKYTTTFTITKSIRRLYNPLAPFLPRVYITKFKMTNDCIEFSYDKRTDKEHGHWHSVLKKEVSHPCFDPEIPPSNTLNLFMQLRLVLQTLLTTEFSIIDVAEIRRENEEIPLSPFKLVRGEQQTLYMKYGFQPTVDPLQFQKLLTLIQSTLVSKLPDELQKRLREIYTKKGLVLDANQRIPDAMKPITINDELEEVEARSVARGRNDPLAFHLDLKTAKNISSKILNILIKEIGIQYKGSFPSLNYLQYMGGVYISPHVFLIDYGIPEPTTPPYFAPSSPVYFPPTSPTASTKSVVSATKKGSQKSSGTPNWGGEGGGSRARRKTRARPKRICSIRRLPRIPSIRRQTKKRST